MNVKEFIVRTGTPGINYGRVSEEVKHVFGEESRYDMDNCYISDDIDSIPFDEFMSFLIIDSDQEPSEIKHFHTKTHLRIEGIDASVIYIRKYPIMKKGIVPLRFDIKLLPFTPKTKKFMRKLMNDEDIYPSLGSGHPWGDKKIDKFIAGTQTDYPFGREFTGHMNAVVELEGNFVGFVMIKPSNWSKVEHLSWQRTKASPFRRPIFSVLTVVISKEYRRRGLASDTIRSIVPFYENIYPCTKVYLTSYLDSTWGRAMSEGLIDRVIPLEMERTRVKPRVLAVYGSEKQKNAFSNCINIFPDDKTGNTVVRIYRDISSEVVTEHEEETYTEVPVFFCYTENGVSVQMSQVSIMDGEKLDTNKHLSEKCIEKIVDLLDSKISPGTWGNVVVNVSGQIVKSLSPMKKEYLKYLEDSIKSTVLC